MGGTEVQKQLNLQTRRRVNWYWVAVASALILVLVAVLTAVCIGFVVFAFGPGSPRYVAVDDDARLTKVAETALPLIDAIRRYHEEYGEYPAVIAATHQFLSGSVIDTQGDKIDGWTYFPTADATGFTLSKSLGWDPMLNYQWNGTSGKWVYDPGDGSAEKEIRLNP